MTADHLIRQYVDRIRRLKAERADISDAIKDVYAEAKANGLHAKTLRQLVDRIEMEPHLRAEADTLLATYEAALGMDAEEAEAAIAATRPDAAAIALNLLTAEIVGLEDEAHAAMLVDHVLYLLDLRAEIALLRVKERERKALAKEEGFDAKQIGVTVRWFEKCAKHGEDAMRLGEETFHLYRGTVEQGQGGGGAVTGDEKLNGLFAPKPARKADKAAKLSGTLAMMRAIDDATRRGGGRG